MKFYLGETYISSESRLRSFGWVFSAILRIKVAPTTEGLTGSAEDCRQWPIKISGDRFYSWTQFDECNPSSLLVHCAKLTLLMISYRTLSTLIWMKSLYNVPSKYDSQVTYKPKISSSFTGKEVERFCGKSSSHTEHILSKKKSQKNLLNLTSEAGCRMVILTRTWLLVIT